MTSSKAPIERHLPPFPPYAAEVVVKDPKRGEDPVAVIARERSGRKQANQIISNLADWYQEVRDSYEKAK